MKRILAILVLGIPFSIAACVSAPVLLWAFATDNESVWRPVGRAWRPVGRAMDRLLGDLEVEDNHPCNWCDEVQPEYQDDKGDLKWPD